MSVMEQATGFKWLSSMLSSDTQLLAAAPGGVWRDLAPPDTATPYMIVSLQAGQDVLTANAFRLFVYGVYQIKAVGPGNNYSGIVTAASRVDALLGRTSGTTTNGIILACYRETPLAVSEIVDGELWNNLGGFYRIAIQGV